MKNKTDNDNLSEEQVTEDSFVIKFFDAFHPLIIS